MSDDKMGAFGYVYMFIYSSFVGYKYLIGEKVNAEKKVTSNERQHWETV